MKTKKRCSMAFVTVCKMYASVNRCTHTIVLFLLYVASLQILHTNHVHGAHSTQINMEFQRTTWNSTGHWFLH